MNPTALALRVGVEDLFAAYVALLDEDRIEDWPAMFTQDAPYRVVARENVARGRPLSTMSCEGRSAMADRVQAVRATSMYIPRTMRHLVSAVQVLPGPDGVTAGANVAVFESLPGQLTSVFCAGRYEAVVVGAVDGAVGTADGLRFAALSVIYDSMLIPTSLVLPL